MLCPRNGIFETGTILIKKSSSGNLLERFFFLRAVRRVLRFFGDAFSLEAIWGTINRDKAG